MGAFPTFAVFSLFRRAMGRTGEIGTLLWFLDLIGVMPGYVQAIQDSGALTGSIFVCIGCSFIFDLFEIVTKPDMQLRPCDDDEPELPMG